MFACVCGFVGVRGQGGTLETLTNEQLVRDFFVKKGLDPKKHFACVTGTDSGT